MANTTTDSQARASSLTTPAQPVQAGWDQQQQRNSFNQGYGPGAYIYPAPAPTSDATGGAGFAQYGGQTYPYVPAPAAPPVAANNPGGQGRNGNRTLWIVTVIAIICIGIPGLAVAIAVLVICCICATAPNR